MVVIGANSSRIGVGGEGRNEPSPKDWSDRANATSRQMPWGRDMDERSPFESVGLEQVMDRC